MIPWLSPLIEEDRQLLGDDWWPYGIEAESQGSRHLPALPLRARSFEAPADLRGYLRAGAPEHLAKS